MQNLKVKKRNGKLENFDVEKINKCDQHKRSVETPHPGKIR